MGTTDDVFGIVGTVQGGSFRVEEVVAEGGFAVVYRAYHGAFRASVALKCLKVPGTLSSDEQKEFLERFREEAELLFRLSTAIPQIVRPLHVGTLSLARGDGRFVPFIAIEWLEGQTLDAIVSGRAARGEPPLSLSRVMELLDEVAGALDRAHRFPGRNGVVSVIHRDLKPENIFIARLHGEEMPKVLDYGIAKVKSAATQIVGQKSADESGLAAFTPAYGAPEQWLPKRFGQTGPWTDVWGLAMTVVECLCGHAPLEGDQAALFGGAIDPERRPTPRNEGVLVSDAVERVFRTALAVDPKDRYHDVATFWSELCAAARATPSPWVHEDGSGGVTVRSPLRAGSLPPDPAGRTVPGPGAAASAEVPDLVVASHPPSRGRPSAASAASVQPEVSPRTPESCRSGGMPSSLLGGNVVSFDDDFERTAPPVPVMQRLDGIGLGPAPARRAVRAPARAMASGAIGPMPAPPLDLKFPIQLMVLSVLLMVGDFVYVSLTGDVFRLGPARTFWIAGPLAAVGLVLMVSRLLSHHD